MDTGVVAGVVAGGRRVVEPHPGGRGASTRPHDAAAYAGNVMVGDCGVRALSDRDAARYRLHTLGWINQQSDLIGGVTALDNAAIKPLAAMGSMRRARRAVSSPIQQLSTGRP